MSNPTAPISPSSVSMNVAASLRQVTVTNLTDLTNYLAGSGVGGMPIPAYGDQVNMAVASYAPAATVSLPAAASNGGVVTGTAAGGSGIVATTTRPSVTPTAATSKPAVTTRPVITGGGNFITFVSANIGSLPASGSIVATSDATNMPTLVTPNGGNGFFTTADKAEHFRFVGLNFVMGSNGIGGCLMLQSPSSDTDSTTHPHHLIVDRCLVHGDPTNGVRAGVQATGAHIAVINNRVYDIFQPGSGATNEDHGILCVGGTGPYLVNNNEIAADSCGLFYGDNTVHNAGIIPSDISITNNRIHKPAKWNYIDNQYSTGTASIDSAGTTITLTGTVASGWNDGTYYFCLLNTTGSNYTDFQNAYPNRVQLISAVSAGVGGTLTLSTAVPIAERSTSGRNFKITKWAGAIPAGQCKNWIEIKHGARILIDSNVFDTSPQGGQATGIVVSTRGSGGYSTDIKVSNNYIKNAPAAFNLVSRPTDQNNGGLGAIAAIVDSVTGTSGGTGGLYEISMSGGPHHAQTGDTVELSGLGGCTEANGVWTLTVVDSTHFTINKTKAQTWTGGGTVFISFHGQPLTRVAIVNNVFEDMGSPQASVSQTSLLGVDVNPTLVPTGGASDAALSSTGTWAFDNFLFEHNTMVSPSGSSWSRDAINVLLAGVPGSTYTVWKSSNVAIRNNIWHVSNAAAVFTADSFLEYDDQTNPKVTGTSGLNSWSTAASRQFSNNAFFEPGNGYTTTSEYATLSGSDAFPNTAYLPDYTGLGFSNYTAGTVGNYVLTDLWTGTCNVSAANPAVITSPSVNFPPTIVKGTPFKVNSDGTFVLVASRDSSTQLTLAGTYPTTGNTMTSTLTFKGWSTDSTDPGANVSTVATAISTVPA